MSKKAVAGLILVAVLAIVYVSLSSYATVQAFQYDDALRNGNANSVLACLERGRTNDGIIGYLRASARRRATCSRPGVLPRPSASSLRAARDGDRVQALGGGGGAATILRGRPDVST